MADNKYNDQGSSSSGSSRDHSGGRRGRGRGHGRVQGSPHNPSIPPTAQPQSPSRSSYKEALAAEGGSSVTAQPQDVSLPQSPISSTEVGSGGGGGQVPSSDHSFQNPSLKLPQPSSQSPQPQHIIFGSIDKVWIPQHHSIPQSPIQMAARSQPPISCTEVGSGSGSGQVQSSYHSIRSPVHKTASEAKPFPAIRRPDKGGTLCVRSVDLLANHFKVKFNSKATILEYVADIEVTKEEGKTLPLKTRDKSKKRSLIENLFPDKLFAYDGKTIFSAKKRDSGKLEVNIRGCVRTFIFNIRESERQKLELKELADYLSERNSDINIRPVLQGLDIVMRENPARSLIQVGRNFYNRTSTGHDLKYGTKEHTGFKQSLKPTSNGLALCLDYSTAAFYKEIPIIDFLTLNVERFKEESDVNRLRRWVEKELRGLKVRETLSGVNRKYTISGLTTEATRELSFIKKGEEQATPVVDYFREKHKVDISNLDIPCLNLGSTEHPIYMPIQYCKLADGQLCLKDDVKLGTVKPEPRMSKIREAVRNAHVYFRDRAVIGDLKIEVANDMTKVDGRVICPPKLKLSSKNGQPHGVLVAEDYHYWNYKNSIFVKGKKVESWALINFLRGNEYEKASITKTFIQKLTARSKILGMEMSNSVVCENGRDMNALSFADDIQEVLQGVVKGRNHLQIIVCLIDGKHFVGYSGLKWISETKMGVMTQCCRYDNYLSCKSRETYLDNLSMKINQKVGGRNMELHELLPGFRDKTSCMFIGADVNHPAANDKIGESIAAVVGTVNWPAANHYIARIERQDGRQETIKKFGEMCKELIETFSETNKKKKPDKIVVFRDGVGEGQFEKVLKDELVPLKAAISVDNYNPKVTVVVAQKRHHTRLFRQNGGKIENVPPGTVVDTVIVHPFQFDFYLCSHYGNLGTSKPTHYHVLYDENKFTSDELQDLIYHLCFTSAKCTKPVSLVPPILYADQAAYRGRMFYDASSRETENAGNDIDRCKLHDRVKNEMFFL